jgi:hypothetical protein
MLPLSGLNVILADRNSLVRVLHAQSSCVAGGALVIAGGFGESVQKA